MTGTFPRAMVLGLCALLASACAGPGYYAQAVGGHLSLMNDRQDVDGYLAQAGPGDPLAERILVARDVLSYAERQLALPADDAYSQVVVTGHDAVVWNVVAAPPLSLVPREWCFIVAGCVPYRGYYDPDDAEAFAARLRQRGDDVIVSPASAYSTLGWFDDPLLDTWLDAPDPYLAGTLVHELAHRRLYVAGDTAFSESYASFVESAGVSRWLQDTGRGEQVAAWQRRKAMSAQWRQLVDRYRGQLANLYATTRPEGERLAAKAELFGALRRDYDRLRNDEWQGSDPWRWFFDAGANNAGMALVSQYQGGHCAFEQLFENSDGDFERFHQAAASIAGRDADTRARWLETPCP
ncbi:aminopeptidase [Marinihelvus fidelis]|uniref:Aminopeptidase n=1 Tax=Marinihelvus fidelis TaxID=2613842 RepID=A0A5N0T6Q5_9GAMM|nr:aminopeptidase [Marinihelvus fidelis]KAA9130481.1 aminopeptidase [Marinihelvus fidelis]